MLINRITVSTNEVLHYPWLSGTDISISYCNNDDFDKLRNCLHTVICVLLPSGIRSSSEVSIEIRQECGSDYTNTFYSSLSFPEIIDQQKVCEYLIGACDRLLNADIRFNEKSKDDERSYSDNQKIIRAFFEELKEKINNKDYKSFYQCVDGMD